jgi:ribonuclease HII
VATGTGMEMVKKKRTKPSSKYELGFQQQGFNYICGVDEAGRGPLAGPVTAAAVVFSDYDPIPGLNDSKMLVPEVREELYNIICSKALSVGIAVGSVELINQVNILQATKRCMWEAIKQLDIKPDYILVDGNMRFNWTIPYRSIIKGDQKCYSIAAASIVAKVYRDRLMVELDKQYPDYGWAQNKGYGTEWHREMIKDHGVTPEHRIKFKGVKEYV